MGEAKARRLRVVRQQADGPVEVELSAKSGKRLAAAYYVSQGAAAVAQAALAQANALQARYREMLGVELDDVEVPEGAEVNHDVDRGLLTVTPKAPA